MKDEHKLFLLMGIIVLVCIGFGAVGYYIGMQQGIDLQVSRYDEWIESNCICGLDTYGTDKLIVNISGIKL